MRSHRVVVLGAAGLGGGAQLEQDRILQLREPLLLAEKALRLLSAQVLHLGGRPPLALLLRHPHLAALLRRALHPHLAALLRRVLRPQLGRVQGLLHACPPVARAPSPQELFYGRVARLQLVDLLLPLELLRRAHVGVTPAVVGLAVVQPLRLGPAHACRHDPVG